MEDPSAILKKAESLEKSARGGFSFFGGRKEKLEDSANEYVRAANGFKARQSYDQAARILERASQIQIEVGEPDDAANSLVQASQCYTAKPDLLPEDATNAARLLRGAITHYTSKGNFRRAASYEEKLADMLEKAGDAQSAVEAFEQAGTWYKVEGSTQMANKMFLKVADNAALTGDYRRAVDRYEEVAKSSASNNLMKWSLKEYFFKAAICHLCTGDVATTKRALQSYVEIDMNFPQQREYMLLQNLIGAIESNDGEGYSEHLFQYSQVSELDKWKVQLFLHIKNTLIQVARPPPAAAINWTPDALPPQEPVGDDGEIDLS
ncbi:putative vesicular-fusion protein sec17 [Sphaerosporella brunnea]|uniref:Putative vesicular-fusion protein sec17 n=1 Tax=Sphaerosporella brunnea TaxID=1250544 RepID=A0A5J5F4M3_9PEZI|nr:putative vesicular-fusion protein sec17 [Sphaerosporella brunnea]